MRRFDSGYISLETVDARVLNKCGRGEEVSVHLFFHLHFEGATSGSDFSINPPPLKLGGKKIKGLKLCSESKGDSIHLAPEPAVCWHSGPCKKKKMCLPLLSTVAMERIIA